MESRVAKVLNPNGIHLRVAADVVKISKRYESKISLAGGACPHADACSILQLLLLEAKKGSEVTINAEGRDARDAVLALSEYFENGGGI